MADLSKMLESLKGMQDQMARVQAELGNITASGESGGGMVKVVANGRQEVISIKIEKEVINPDDAEMLEDLIVAAVNRAINTAKEAGEAKMNEVTRSMMPNAIHITGARNADRTAFRTSHDRTQDGTTSRAVYAQTATR
jgi:nucleoid-associated protein EbfC